VEVLAFRQAEGDFGRRLAHALAHRDLDAPLDFADVFEIGVEAGLVARTQVSLKERDFLGY